MQFPYVTAERPGRLMTWPEVSKIKRKETGRNLLNDEAPFPYRMVRMNTLFLHSNSKTTDLISLLNDLGGRLLDVRTFKIIIMCGKEPASYWHEELRPCIENLLYLSEKEKHGIFTSWEKKHSAGKSFENKLVLLRGGWNLNNIAPLVREVRDYCNQTILENIIVINLHLPDEMGVKSRIDYDYIIWKLFKGAAPDNFFSINLWNDIYGRANRAYEISEHYHYLAYDQIKSDAPLVSRFVWIGLDDYRNANYSVEKGWQTLRRFGLLKGLSAFEAQVVRLSPYEEVKDFHLRDGKLVVTGESDAKKLCQEMTDLWIQEESCMAEILLSHGHSRRAAKKLGGISHRVLSGEEESVGYSTLNHHQLVILPRKVSVDKPCTEINTQSDSWQMMGNAGVLSNQCDDSIECLGVPGKSHDILHTVTDAFRKCFLIRKPSLERYFHSFVKGCDQFGQCESAWPCVGNIEREWINRIDPYIFSLMFIDFIANILTAWTGLMELTRNLIRSLNNLI